MLMCYKETSLFGLRGNTFSVGEYHNLNRRLEGNGYLCKTLYPLLHVMHLPSLAIQADYYCARRLQEYQATRLQEYQAATRLQELWVRSESAEEYGADLALILK